MTFSSGLEEGYKQAKYAIESKRALNKFYEFVHAQGGSLRNVHVADNKIKVHSKKSGIITKIDAYGAGELAAKLGASKKTLNDKIDYTVGIMLNKYVGEDVEKDDVLFTIYTNNPNIEFNESDFSFIEVNDGIE